MSEARLRIGEVSRRLGLSVEVLRAWEERYGVPSPERTGGGLRMYSPEDVERLQRMQRLLSDGLSAGEAARVAGEAPAGAPAERAGAAAAPLAELAAELEQTTDRFDDAGAQAVLDRLFAGYDQLLALRDVILPFLTRLGDRWADGRVTVAQEHFTSTLIRSRLLALGRGWDRGRGHRAVLACPSGELHDIGLICFGLALREQGWRVTYLGQDTPGETLLDAVRSLEPDAVVVAAAAAAPLRKAGATLQRVGALTRLYVAGAGASPSLPGQWLEGDAVGGAAAVAASGAPT